MKQKIFTLFVVFIALFAIKNNTNAAIYVANENGNWSAVATWLVEGSVPATEPASTDSVVVPSGFTVTIDAATGTRNCSGITVQNGGIVIIGQTFYTQNVVVNTGGVFKSSGTSTSGGKGLMIGFLGTAQQEGNFLIQNDGQFGGTATGTADGIGIFISEKATSLTIQGTASGTGGKAYLQRILANNGIEWTGDNNFDLNIKQSIVLGNNNAGMGLSLQNNKAFKIGTTRTCTIYPGCTVSFPNGSRFHANNGVMAAAEGNFIYNVYGTLDLNGSNFDFYCASAAASNTQSMTLNLGNGTDYARLILGRTIKLNKYFETQTINLNVNNANSKVIFSGNGAITITCSGFYNGSAYVDDARVFPENIRNVSLENTSTTAALTFPRKVTVADTLYTYGNGHKMYIGAVADATAKTVNMGRLFNLNNNAYVVTAVSNPLTTVTATTLGAAGSWEKGATLTDASGNQYYCDSVGIYAGVVKFMNATGGAEFTGAPIQVSGDVTSNLSSGNTGRFSAAAYIGGNTVNGAGTLYFAKNSTVGGSFTNNGTVTLTGDLETGDLTNNGTITLGTKMLTLNGNISGNNIDASTGYVQYGGIADRTISGFTGNTFAGLRLNTIGTITLGGATTATGLTLTKGKLALGNYDFAPATLSGGSSTAYVVTNGTGKLSLTTTDATAKLFPVGISSTSYDPVTVTPATGTATAVKVSSTLSGTAVTGVKYNSAEWDITPSVASSTVLAFTPSVIDSQVAANTASPVIGHYVGGSYVNNNSVTYSDGTFTGTFDSFSPFVTGANVGTTGLNNPSKFSMYAQNGMVHIQGISANDQIAVYTMNGQLVTKIQASGSQAQIALQSGVYVVRINAGVSKITL